MSEAWRPVFIGCERASGHHDKGASMSFWKLVKATGLAILVVVIASYLVPFVVQYASYPGPDEHNVFGVQFFSEHLFSIVPFGILTFLIIYFDWKRPGS